MGDRSDCLYNDRMSSDTTATGAAAYEILSQCLAGRTHKLARKIDAVYNEELRRVDLRNTQLTLLCVLEYMGEAVQGELAAILVMEQSTLSRNLRLIEERGWVRSAPPRGRSRRLRLTPAGKRKVRDSLRSWRRAQERAQGMLPDGAVEKLRELGDAVGARPGEHSKAG